MIAGTPANGNRPIRAYLRRMRVSTFSIFLPDSFFFALFFFAMLLSLLLRVPVTRLKPGSACARRSGSGLSAGQLAYQTPLLRRFCTFGIFFLLASFFFAAFFFAMLLSLPRRAA
jgi:hypothetical protein